MTFTNLSVIEIAASAGLAYAGYKAYSNTSSDMQTPGMILIAVGAYTMMSGSATAANTNPNDSWNPEAVGGLALGNLGVMDMVILGAAGYAIFKLYQNGNFMTEAVIASISLAYMLYEAFTGAGEL